MVCQPVDPPCISPPCDGVDEDGDEGLHDVWIRTVPPTHV